MSTQTEKTSTQSQAGSYMALRSSSATTSAQSNQLSPECGSPESSTTATTGTSTFEPNTHFEECNMADENTTPCPKKKPLFMRPPQPSIRLLDDDSDPDATSDEEAEAARMTEEDEGLVKVLAMMSGGRALIERNMKRVGACDGSDATKTLAWLRALDTIPTSIETARAMAEGPLGQFVGSQQIQRWDKLRLKIAEEFISSAFRQKQREALEELRQRQGESLQRFNHEFERTLNEAYKELPVDQEALIRTYLSALADRSMALSVVKTRPATLAKAVKAVVQRSRTSDLLKPKASGKAHALTLDEPSTPYADISKALQQMAASQDRLVELQDKLTCRMANLEAPQCHAAASNSPKGVTGKLECFRCGKPGHFARECRTLPKADQTSRPTYTPNTHTAERCERCRLTNHRVQNCRAGPPRKPCYCGGAHWLYDCPERQSNTATKN